MDFFNEYALLFAVAAPVVAIAGLQVFLFFGGERDTLLVPGLVRYPSVAYGKGEEAVAAPVPMPAATRVEAPVGSSNDELVREAA